MNHSLKNDNSSWQGTYVTNNYFYDNSYTLYDYNKGAYEPFSDPYDYQYSPYEFYDGPDSYYNTTYNYYYYSFDPDRRENSSEVSGNDTHSTYNYNYHYYDSPYGDTPGGDKDPSFLGEDEDPKKNNEKPKDKNTDPAVESPQRGQRVADRACVKGFQWYENDDETCLGDYTDSQYLAPKDQRLVDVWNLGSYECVPLGGEDLIHGLRVECFADGFRELWYLDGACLEPFASNFYSFHTCEKYQKYDGSVGNLIMVPQEVPRVTSSAMSK